MSISERFKRWYHEFCSYLKPMTFRQKISYLFTYYKSWLLIAILLIAAIGFTADVIMQRQQETLLLGFFTNDDYGLFDSRKIQKDFSQRISLEKNQNIILDDDFYIDVEGGARNYSAASNGKIIAYMSVGELDFIVTCKDIYEHYSGNVPMLDLRELLPEDLFQELEQYMVYGKNYDAQGNLQDNCPLGIDLRASRYLRDSGLPQGSFYFFVPYQAPHRAMIIEFLRYSFE